MPLHTFNQLETRMNLEKPVAKLKSYSGHFIDVKGIATLPCEHKGRKYQVKFHIVNSEVPAVLSANTCAEMGLVQRIHAIESNHSKPSQPPPLSTHTSSVNTDESDMLKDYPDLFSVTGTKSKKKASMLSSLWLRVPQCLGTTTMRSQSHCPLMPVPRGSVQRFFKRASQ